MNPGLRTYDIWRRDWIRLLVGFVFLGFGLFGWAIFPWPGLGSSLPTTGKWIIGLLAAACSIAGSCIICFRRLVFIDPEHRELILVSYFLYLPFRRRILSFGDLREVQVLHQRSEGGDGEEGGYYCWVGILPAAGRVIWLKTFNSPKAGPSDEALAFAREVAATTGLKLEVRSKS